VAITRSRGCRHFGLDLHTHELREGPDAELLHHLAAVHFDGALTDTEISRDHLVHFPVRHSLEYVPLTVGQRRQFLVERGATQRCLVHRVIETQRFVDALQEIVFAERLANEVDGAATHRLDGHRDITVSRNEDNRQIRSHIDQLFLQIQPGHARHADVEHQAAAPRHVVRIEELVGRIKQLTRLPYRVQQQAEPVAHTFVVVNDEYCLLFVHLYALVWPPAG
jgi:hypothetical protein